MAPQVGLESLFKRSFNTMESSGRHKKQWWYMQGNANGRGLAGEMK